MNPLTKQSICAKRINRIRLAATFDELCAARVYLSQQCFSNCESYAILDSDLTSDFEIVANVERLLGWREFLSLYFADDDAVTVLLPRETFELRTYSL